MNRLNFNGITGNGEFYQINNVQSYPNEGYYFLSNDVIRVNFKKSLKDRKYFTAIGIANPHYLHVLGELLFYIKQPIKITAIDYNMSQLQHFKYFINLISCSNNRIEFLQNLFKIKFSYAAIQILQQIKPNPLGHTRGGIKKDKYFSIEKSLWRESKFFREDFIDEYSIPDVVKTEQGLKIRTQTIGDIDTYYATIVSASKQDYDYWPFTTAFGSGFLRTEDSFLALKHLIGQSEMFYIHGNITQVLPDILLANRYKTIICWVSNVFIDYFIKKTPELRELKRTLIQLGTNREPNFPELDLVFVQDMRESIEIPKALNACKVRNRSLSIHTKTFSSVEKYIQGVKNIEIINMPRWFEQDNGVSKLPNMTYMMADSFFNHTDCPQYDTIFIHILVGHGMPYNMYRKILKKSFDHSKCLIILEHNRNSKDFKKDNIGLTAQDIRDILGIELFFEYSPGRHTKDRNLLFVYRGKLA